MKLVSKVLLVAALVLLVCGALSALAEEAEPTTTPDAQVDEGDADEGPAPEPINIPAWAEALMFGTVSLATIAWAATELSKRLFMLLGVYQDGWARYIVLAWSAVLVLLALGGEMLGVQNAVTGRVLWVYQLVQFLLVLLGAPAVHKIAQSTGLTEGAGEVRAVG